jgi:hypothetical protein
LKIIHYYCHRIASHSVLRQVRDFVEDPDSVDDLARSNARDR